MKKISAAVAAIAAVLSAGSLAGCVNPVSNLARYTYANSANYSVGGGEIASTVTAMNIDWVSGAVEIVYADVDGVTLEEAPAAPMTSDISGDNELRYFVDNGVLRVKYVKSGTSCAGVHKKLTVTLPDGDLLGKMEINTVSASIGAAVLKAEVLSLESVSGGISIGEVYAEKFDAESVSGRIGAKIVGASDVDAESVSGSIAFTVDPSVTCVYDIESVSGGVELRLTADAPFTVDFDTVSGSFASDFETVKSGNKHAHGAGGVTFGIDTVSGGVRVVKGY